MRGSCHGKSAFPEFVNIGPMTDTWQHALETLGATVTGGEVEHFGDPAKELAATANATVLADISHLGLIQVSGPDALTFLQGQLTQDIATISAERAGYAGHCSPKGRLLAHFLVWKSDDSYFLQLPRELVEPIQNRLKMYVLRSKVILADGSESSIRLGIAGADAAALVAAVFGSAPAQPMAVVRTSQGTVIALSDGRYEILVAGDASELWRRLAQQAQPVGAAVWRWLRIRAGIPEIYIATQDQLVPQMVNYDLIGAVSFQKGCYTGQEIVARLHYLGKAKRRMVGAHLNIPETPQPGDAIYGLKLEGQTIGMVVDVAAAPHGGWDLLISIPVNENADSVLYFKTPGAPEIQVNTFTTNLDEK